VGIEGLLLLKNDWPAKQYFKPMQAKVATAVEECHHSVKGLIGSLLRAAEKISVATNHNSDLGSTIATHI